jgi:hypothetical protein
MTAQQRGQWWSWLWCRSRLVLLGFLAVGAFYLLTEHTAHVYGALPLLLFALCPLMDLFMHGGHGGHTGHGEPGEGERP